MIIKFKKEHPDAVLPTPAKEGDAGRDITCVDDGRLVIKLGAEYWEYSLGLSVEIPSGYVGLLFPRSSQSNTGLMLANCVGVVDSGFRGVLTARFKEEKLQQDRTRYKKGDRVVQLVVMPYVNYASEWADSLSSTDRGTGGFGSTGS